MTQVERLQKAGLAKAASRVQELRDRKWKMTVAYEHYRYVRQEKIDAFNGRLRQTTQQVLGYTTTYDVLVFVPLEQYDQVPPDSILEALEVAQGRGCFDTFEVAKIQSVTEVKDPIVFGRIAGCADRFFIAQWDDDVKIEEILQENEG